MPSLLIRNASLVRHAGVRNPESTDILIRDALIENIGPKLSDPADEILDVEGDLVIPGLINSHLHSSGNLMRGTLDGLPLEIFMLYEVPQTSGGVEDPSTVRLRTLLGAVEMLKLGITSVADDAFFVPLTTSGAIDAIAQAYLDSGMRATIGLDQPIVVEYAKYPFLEALLSPSQRRMMDGQPRESAEGMLAHYAHLIDTWHGAGEGRIGAAVSCSALQRATPEYLRSLHELARTHDLPFFCHILETRLQRVLGQELYGHSLVRRAAELGLLDERMQVIHAIWVDDEDMRLLGASGAIVAHNPVCNLRLGSGIMPFRSLRDAGVPICLGTDEAVSDDSHNLWGAMKVAATVHAICDADSSRWPTCIEVLEALWEGGDRVLRRPERLGRIEPGAAADLAVLDQDAPAYRPLHDVRRQLVLCESGASVRHTIVAGRIVVRDREVTSVDERALVRELRELEPALREQAAALRASVADIEPVYRRMVEMSEAVDVGMRRRVAP